MPEKKKIDYHKQGRSNRRKGAAGELELAKVLNELLGIAAIRGRQFCGSSGNPDVILQKKAGGKIVDVPGLHVECKRVECLKLYDALSQSISDAREGEIPVVCHRRNNKPWVIIFELDKLKDIADWIKSLEDNKDESGV